MKARAAKAIVKAYDILHDVSFVYPYIRIYVYGISVYPYVRASVDLERLQILRHASA